MSSASFQKQKLLSEWWTPFLGTNAVTILQAGESLSRNLLLTRVKQLVSRMPKEIVVYVLFQATTDGHLPVYVGKSHNPLLRWKSHADAWLAGKKSYRRWQVSLLNEEGNSLFNLDLLIVPASSIAHPAIPGFPTSVGSIEYQLVGLASDAFPGVLLNDIGVGR